MSHVMSHASRLERPEPLDPVTAAIGDHVAGALERPLSSEVLEKTRDHLIDTVAAIVSGSELPAGIAGRAFVAGLRGQGEASVVCGGMRTNVVDAALANAMAAHGDETDDFHMGSITHPGCGVVPAALAIAETQARTGMDLMRAVCVGYDICARIPMAIDAYHQFSVGRGMHGFGGMFGAGAAAAALLRLDARGVAHTMSFVVQQASGLTCWRRDEAHIEKAFTFAGMAARNGVTAATIVASGVPAVDDALTGVNGLFRAYAPDGFDWAAPFSDLGERWEVMESSIKKWCVGSPGQAALDAVTALIAEHDVMPDEIVDFDIVLPDEVSHIVAEGRAANVDIRHLAALYFVDRRLGFASIHDDARLRDPRVAALRERARVVPSAELTIARPRRQAIVVVRCTDGRELRHHARVVRGTPADPMSRAEVLDKARDLMGPVIGSSRTRDVLDALLTLEQAPGIGGLVSTLSAPGTGH